MPSWLNRNVLSLSLVSLLNDASSEMVLPLLPYFLVHILGGGPAELGRIEGLANGLSNLLKYWSGKQTDKSRKTRSWILGGYALSSLTRPLLGLVVAPYQLLLVRGMDRVGKGIRTSPRDVLLASSCSSEDRASAFSFHRAMDHAGAVVGSLLGWLGLSVFQLELRTLFLWTWVPGLVTLGVLALGLKEEAPAKVERTEGEAFVLDRQSRHFLIATTLAALGLGSETLLLLAAGRSESGEELPLTTLPLLWMALSLSKSLFSLLAGPVARKLSSKGAWLCGKAAHILLMLGFAWFDQPEIGVILLLLHGLHDGLTEGNEKAILSSLVPESGRGTAFGWWNLWTGFGVLIGASGFGLVWEELGRGWAFGGASGISILSLGVMAALKQK
jgi:sugar phosphate permease